jgi:hypothetical protein
VSLGETYTQKVALTLKKKYLQLWEGAFSLRKVALHQKSGVGTRNGSLLLNKAPLPVGACNFGARPLLPMNFSHLRKRRERIFSLEHVTLESPTEEPLRSDVSITGHSRLGFRVLPPLYSIV